MLEKSHALRLTSKLADLRAVKPNLRCCRQQPLRKSHLDHKKEPPQGRFLKQTGRREAPIRPQSAWRFVRRTPWRLNTAICAAKRCSSNLRRLRLRSFTATPSIKKEPPQGRFFLYGRDDRIRTCDFHVPNKYAIVF